MPWYVACGFAGYAVLLVWQVTELFKAGTKAFLAMPFLLIKLGVLAVALSYWHPDACSMAKHLGRFAVVIAGVLTFSEARANLGPVLLNPTHAPEADNIVLIFTILATVVFPAIVFFFAATVVLTDGCASLPSGT
jgi:hypothetical protein